VIDAFAAAFLLAGAIGAADTPAMPAASACTDRGRRGRLLYQDDFEGPLAQWAVEVQQSATSRVSADQGKLTIDAAAGATVWFRPRLSGDVLISYRRKVLVEGGPNDRLSDMNQFWMAAEPDGTLAFRRTGKFEDYDTLPMYYAGIGGNTNTTTRLRRYTSDGSKPLVAEASGPAHLLQPNREYAIAVEVYHGCTRISVDGQPWLAYQDPKPLLDGWFGLRTTWSHQEVTAFRIYRLE
jgi:hypothetical protein